MNTGEKKTINEKLAEIALSFGLKINLDMNNAQKIIEDNYKKIRDIDSRIQKRVSSLKNYIN